MPPFWDRRGPLPPAETLSPGERAQISLRQLRFARRDATVRSLGVSLGGGIILVLIGYGLSNSAGGPWQKIVDLVVVAWFSGFVAYAELVSRYHDSPVRLIGAPPTPLYLLINIAAGIAALLIVEKLALTDGTKAPRLYAILLAGFGSMAFFRTSLFTLRVGDTDIGIGPSAVLQSLLAAADRMIDRDQAQGRATDVAAIMRQVDFAKAQAALPSLCFVLVENMTPADQEGVSQQIKQLADAADISADQKAVILGVYLIRQVGAHVLDLAVQALGVEIRKEPAPSGAAR